MPCGDLTAAALRSHGRRVTTQRVAVTEALRHSGGHMTASEVIAAVRAAAPHIDTSTVYRTLSDLRDTGLIAETLLGYGESLYEWIGDDPHQHFKCSNCGRLERVDPAITAALVRSAATRHGFAVDLAHMVFAGECASCHAARRSGR